MTHTTHTTTTKMSTKPTITIVPAEFPRDKAIVADNFVALAGILPAHINLTHQSFDAELAGLPGAYSTENGGAVLLAYATTPTSSTCVGCVGVRALNIAPNTCELKRLWTNPEARGLGAGQALMVAIMAKAREMGYKEMLLDTLAIFTSARKMYDSYGFVEIAKYNNNPFEGVVFMKAKLQ